MEFDDFSHGVVERAKRRLRAVDVPRSPESLGNVLSHMWLGDLYAVIACDLRRPGAWPWFTRAYLPRLQGLARHLGAAEPDVQSRDLVADLSLPPRHGPARTVLGTYQGHGSLFAWLAVVMRRRLADRARAPAPVVDRHPDTRAALRSRRVLDPSEALIDQETATRLVTAFRAAWNALAVQERVALLYKYRDDLSQRHIARLLGVSESRVSRVLKQGIAKLRTAVLARFREEDPRQWESRDRLWGSIAASLSDHLAATEPVRGPPKREGGTSLA